MTREIKADLYRYHQLTGLRGFIKGLSIPGFRYTYVMRKVAQSKRYSLSWLIFGILKRKYGYKYGFQIPASTEIGEGLYIGHYGSIIINEKAKIGKNCNLAPGITIGQTFRGKLMGNPTIGDKVWIGGGAVIVGKITIGSNVLIAPNSYVNVDVPDNSLVMGNPCKIIHKDNPCEGYLNFVLE